MTQYELFCQNTQQWLAGYATTLTEENENLKRQLEDANEKVARLGGAEIPNRWFVDERVREVTRELVIAEGKLAQAEARLAALEGTKNAQELELPAPEPRMRMRLT